MKNILIVCIRWTAQKWPRLVENRLKPVKTRIKKSYCIFEFLGVWNWGKCHKCSLKIILMSPVLKVKTMLADMSNYFQRIKLVNAEFLRARFQGQNFIIKISLLSKSIALLPNLQFFFRYNWVEFHGRLKAVTSSLLGDGTLIMTIVLKLWPLKRYWKLIFRTGRLKEILIWIMMIPKSWHT